MNRTMWEKSFCESFFSLQSFLYGFLLWGDVERQRKDDYEKSFNLSTQYFKTLDCSCQLKSISIYILVLKNFHIEVSIILIVQKILNYINL